MKKRITGKASKLPIGCILAQDLRLDSGIILYPEMTIIDAEKIKNINNCLDLISIMVELPDAESDTKPENKQFEFEESFKQYANESVQNIYKNINDPEKIARQTEELSENLCRTIKESKEIGINISKLKISDEYTYKHSIDVGTIAAMIATSMYEDQEMINDTAIAGILHDIGKEGIPKDILNKPGKLTNEEFNIIKQHPVFGYQMLMRTDELSEEIKQGILNHHENMDGTGYPRRLKGDAIGEIGKIIAVADVFDALVTKRPYKEAKSPAEAIEIMFTMSNKFDIEIFKTFLDIVHIYPDGSKITLSNNETATVISQNRSYPLRPVIKIDNSDKIVNLSTDMNYLSVIII